MPKFDFPNYRQIMKLEKREYNAIKASISQIFQSLGKHGTTRPVAYDTAWAARVPKFNNLAQPAFPQCLQWLRDNQKEDGSWGDDYPPSVCSSVLNTLTAILAFSQWKLPEDDEGLVKGIEALTKLSEKLPKEKTGSLTFEILLSALVDDCRNYGLNIPYQNFESFVTVGHEGVKKIQKGLVSNVPNQYWTILEAAGKLELHPAYYRAEIKRHGLIAAQPSTTAFILMKARLKGEDFIEAEWVLKKLSEENNGGLPHLYPCDNFDLTHSLDFLTKVGINPIFNDKHVAANNAIEALSERWSVENGIGFSSRWQFSDSNCTETAAIVLSRCSNKPKHVIKKMASFDDSTMDESKSPSIRNISNYYRFMRTVLKIYLNNTRHLPNILEKMIKYQNSDGGWGGQGKSSVEETAYVCLAIFELIKYRSDFLYCIDFRKLVDFMHKTKSTPENESVWMWKVSFSSPGLSEAAIIAAKYAVFQIQRVCMMTDAFNVCKLDFLEVDFSDSTTDDVIYHGNCLRFNLEGCPENTENRKKVLDTLLTTFFDDGLSPYSRPMIETYLDVCYHIHPVELSLEYRVIDIAGIFFVVAIDDIVDLFHPGQGDMVDGLDEFLRTSIAILEGRCESSTIALPFESPFCTYFVKFLRFLQNSIRENRWNCKNFVKELKDLFHSHIMVRKDLCNNIAPTVKRYLQIHSVSSTLRTLIQQIFMIDGVAGSAESENVDAYNRFLQSACKVCRLLSDFPSVLKDEELPTLDNFCLRLQFEYKVSMQEAVQRTVKKINKEILKMHTLKKIIQKDAKYLKYADLPVRMKYVDVFLDGTLMWSLSTFRYKSKWRKNSTTIQHKEEDVTFVRNLCFDI